MKRRSFFAGAVAAVAGLIGVARSSAAARFDPTIPDRDQFGKAYCRIYRQDAAGEWREIKFPQLAAGDKIISVGQDGGRLFRCESLTVERVIPPGDEIPVWGCRYTDEGVKSLM